MDLLSLIRTFWRFKVVSFGVIVATIGLAIGFVVVVPPGYTATSSYLLVEPPDPPTEAEVMANPRLARVQSDNPYMRYTDTSVILNVVAQRVATERAREAVQATGGNPDYEVAPSNRFGGPSPIVDVTARGSEEAEVFKTLDVVSRDLARQLQAVQAAEEVDDDYMFTLRRVEYPESAERVVTGTLRTVIGIGIMGALVLVVLLALLQARSAPARARRAAEVEGTTADPPPRRSP